MSMELQSEIKEWLETLKIIKVPSDELGGNFQQVRDGRAAAVAWRSRMGFDIKPEENLTDTAGDAHPSSILQTSVKTQDEANLLRELMDAEKIGYITQYNSALGIYSFRLNGDDFEKCFPDVSLMSTDDAMKYIEDLEAIKREHFLGSKEII